MTYIDIKPKMRKQVRVAAKEFATTLVRHPMLSMMITSTMAKAGIPIDEDSKDLFLEETVAALHRMVFGQ